MADPNFKAAVVQTAPVCMYLPSSVAKAIRRPRNGSTARGGQARRDHAMHPYRSTAAACKLQDRIDTRNLADGKPLA